MDWLPVVAPEPERQRCGSVATDLSEPQDPASFNDCLSFDFVKDNAMHSMGISESSQLPPMSSLWRDSGIGATPSQWTYPYSSLLTPSRAFTHPFSSMRENEGESQDLPQKIPEESFDFELQSTPQTFNTSMAAQGSQWTDPAANTHDAFDPKQLSHLLNDEGQAPSGRDSGSSEPEPRIQCEFWHFKEDQVSQKSH